MMLGGKLTAPGLSCRNRQAYKHADPRLPRKPMRVTEDHWRGRQRKFPEREEVGGYLPSKKSRFLMINGRHFAGTANSSKMALTGHTDSQ